MTPAFGLTTYDVSIMGTVDNEQAVLSAPTASELRWRSLEVAPAKAGVDLNQNSFHFTTRSISVWARCGHEIP